MSGPTVGHSQSALYICRDSFMTPRTMCAQRECVKRICPDAFETYVPPEVSSRI